MPIENRPRRSKFAYRHFGPLSLYCSTFLERTKDEFYTIRVRDREGQERRKLGKLAIFSQREARLSLPRVGQMAGTRPLTIPLGVRWQVLARKGVDNFRILRRPANGEPFETLLQLNLDGKLRISGLCLGASEGEPGDCRKLHVQADSSGFNCPGDTAIYGENSEGRGVTGFSNDGPGLFGTSASNAGVEGHSGESQGVVGKSDTSTGVAGYSTSGTYIFEGFDSGAGGGRRLALERATGNLFITGSYFCPGACALKSGSADVAEHIEASEKLEPGDVVEIDPHQAEHYRLARSAYSTHVAGVISTQPGVILGNHFDKDKNNWQDDRPMLALTGTVPVKVTAENGPIQPGDLLVSSSTPGYAMKAKPVVINGIEIYPTGSILGKALESLETSTGVIKVLVMLR